MSTEELEKTADNFEIEDVETEENAEPSEIESEDDTEAQAEDDTEQAGEKAEGEETDAEDLVVSLGDDPGEADPADQAAPDWVRELRQKNREQARENRELKERLKSLENPEPAQKPLGPKPTLSDFDYDAPEYEAALESWHEKKRQREQEEKAQREKEENAQKEWQQKLNQYAEAKASLKFKDVEDAEANVLETLSETQQGVILQGAENPALLIYALGKNTRKAKELGAISDPVKFAFAVAKLEKDLKVTNRKSPPPPEKRVSGSGSNAGAVDNQLEKLRLEAQKTGNYTKVHEYKRKRRQAKA